MKVCTKCGTAYTDTTLAFCLADGTPLRADSGIAETEILRGIPDQKATAGSIIPETEVTNRETDQNVVNSNEPAKSNGVSRFWLFSTFGLIGVIILVPIIGFFLFTGTKTGEIGANSPNTDLKPATGDGSIQKPSVPLYRVVGVKSNDVLYIRPAPGNLKVVVGKIPPDGRGIEITGRGRKIGKSTWVPIAYQGVRGWVNSRFLGKLP